MFKFVRDHVVDGTSGAMYLSGSPPRPPAIRTTLALCRPFFPSVVPPPLPSLPLRLIHLRPSASARRHRRPRNRQDSHAPRAAPHRPHRVGGPSGGDAQLHVQPRDRHAADTGRTGGRGGLRGSEVRCTGGVCPPWLWPCPSPSFLISGRPLLNRRKILSSLFGFLPSSSSPRTVLPPLSL